MKILIPIKQLSDNYGQWLKNQGYHLIVDRRRNKESFVRSLARGNYPRFHIYVTANDNDLTVDLHLDHKQASYEGQKMHNAEYDGDLVQAEIARLAAAAGVTVAGAKEAKPLPGALRPPQELTRFTGRRLPFAHQPLHEHQTPATADKKWWQIFN